MWRAIGCMHKVLIIMLIKYCHLPSREDIIIPIVTQYDSSVVFCENNNDRLVDYLEWWRFAIDYKKLNTITH